LNNNHNKKAGIPAFHYENYPIENTEKARLFESKMRTSDFSYLLSPWLRATFSLERRALLHIRAELY
jgi:hypothetical protein